MYLKVQLQWMICQHHQHLKFSSFHKLAFSYIQNGTFYNFLLLQMFARATSGDKRNNNKFSSCSLKAIEPVLNAKARSAKGCFTGTYNTTHKFSRFRCTLHPIRCVRFYESYNFPFPFIRSTLFISPVFWNTCTFTRISNLMFKTTIRLISEPIQRVKRLYRTFVLNWEQQAKSIIPICSQIIL